MVLGYLKWYDFASSAGEYKIPLTNYLLLLLPYMKFLIRHYNVPVRSYFTIAKCMMNGEVFVNSNKTRNFLSLI